MTSPAVDERAALLKTRRELELCYAALAKQPRGFLSTAEAFVCVWASSVSVSSRTGNRDSDFLWWSLCVCAIMKQEEDKHVV